VYLHGAHVTHYQPGGASPVLLTSSRSLFTSGRAIRGGVPVIFPWFGPHPNDPHAPDHGFARILEWSVEAVEPSGDAVTLVLDTDLDISRGAVPYIVIQVIAIAAVVAFPAIATWLPEQAFDLSLPRGGKFKE